MRPLAATLLFSLMTRTGFGHEGSDVVALPSNGGSFDPWLVVPMYIVAISFLIGSWRLWRRAGFGRGILQWQAACFWTGWPDARPHATLMLAPAAIIGNLHPKKQRKIEIKKS